MYAPYTYRLKNDGHGRITEKTETVAGEAITWTYAYDKEGRLTEARLNGQLVCHCDYDGDGRRIRDRFPLTAGNTFRNYEYNRMTGRLMRAGDSRFTHDKAGFRSIRNDRGRYTTYQYAPDYRLIAAHQEDEDIRYNFKHDGNGQRRAKFRNGQLAEAYLWRDFIRLAGFHDGEDAYEFAYRQGDRLPAAMVSAGGAVGLLFYDQVGSLRVVADRNGKVIKEILYDPFGGILEDTNPDLRIPLGFSGGLHDRDLGLIRFGWRDYDPTTGRWTAPDPMGDAGGDPDWYGYCLGDPVNMVDPLGLNGWGFGPGGHDYDGSDWDSKDDDKKGDQEDTGSGGKDVGWGFGPGGHTFPDGGKKGQNPKDNQDDKNGNTTTNGDWTDYEVTRSPQKPSEEKPKEKKEDTKPIESSLYQQSRRAAKSFLDDYLTEQVEPEESGYNPRKLAGADSEAGATMEISGLVYDQEKQTLDILDETGLPRTRIGATSGRLGILDETLKDKGPIPKGQYNLDPTQTYQLSWFDKLRDLRDWGNFRAPLEPLEETNTYGRSGFYIHGGKRPGSAGCIDCGSYDDLFEQLQKQNNSIKVTVK